jgi:prepilin-type processing-associated H-X9-DG protein
VSTAPGASRTLVRLNESTPASWTRELHGLKGNELFADGHAERANSRTIELPRRNAPAVMDLMLPTLRPAATPPAALARFEWGDHLRMPPKP